MKLKALADTPPWEWPPDADDTFKQVLRDRAASEEDRTLAADLASEIVAMDDEIAGLLVGIITSPAESAALRGRAAIALGPVLEQTDIDGFDDPYLDEPPITEETFEHVKDTLRVAYDDPSAPKELRRRALEAAVRADQDWLKDAVRSAWNSDDPEWRLTAVFAMRYVGGFEAEILEALKTSDPDLHNEAVRTAGERGIRPAWPHVKALLDSPGTEKNLKLSAIAASAWINPYEAGPALVDLVDSDDPEIAEAAEEAMSEAETAKISYSDDDDEDEEEEDEIEGGGYVN